MLKTWQSSNRLFGMAEAGCHGNINFILTAHSFSRSDASPSESFPAAGSIRINVQPQQHLLFNTTHLTLDGRRFSDEAQKIDFHFLAFLEFRGTESWNTASWKPGPVHTCIDGLAQDCSISSASAMEILQSCTKPSISQTHKHKIFRKWLYNIKPFPQPMLTCHQRCSVAFTREQFHKNCSWS